MSLRWLASHPRIPIELMNYDYQREQMVERQIRRRGVRDELVLEAMRAVPRHLFVPKNARDLAYEDHPLSIGSGQTISQPYIVAFMTESLLLKGDEKILEIGAGSGYQAAILATMGCTVFSMERLPQLATLAQSNINSAKEAGIDNLSKVNVIVGDGTLGCPEETPFDRIIVTAAGPEVPPTLLSQLAPDGILLIPVGLRWSQELIRIRRREEGDVRETILGCVFVPLIGEEGWKDVP